MNGSGFVVRRRNWPKLDGVYAVRGDGRRWGE